jgi:type VI protein secretion system component VasK
VFKLAQLARGMVASETARLKLGLFRVGTALLMLTVAAVILLIGASFLLSGIYQSLLQYTSPWAAGGIITLVSLLIAALLLFAARRRLSVGRRPSAVSSPPAAEAAEELRQATERGIRAGEEIKRGLRPIDLVLSAFIAGMIVSRSARTASQRCKTREGTGS